jgi:hypothetical protein
MCMLSVMLTLRFTGQKYIHTIKDIFHIEPLIFKTSSWCHFLSDFHEIFSINHRNDMWECTLTGSRLVHQQDSGQLKLI